MTPTMTPHPWPPLPFNRWNDTCETLHMWTQIVGKMCLALTPRVNHFWNVTLHITSRGLITPPLPYGDRVFTMTFDFVEHELAIQASDGDRQTVALKPRTVADFYSDLMGRLGHMGIDVRIWTMPVEFPRPIRFDQDLTHRSYDAAFAGAFWQTLVALEPVFAEFRSKFIGKCSPLHFFWGSFDLAVTRFSGRRAPERPGADAVTRESYSHEVISHGFWPGSDALPEPAFYAYAAPEPAGLREATVRPAVAYYHREMSMFILPYEAVRRSPSPGRDLMDFLDTTYDQAATLAGWERSALDRR